MKHLKRLALSLLLVLSITVTAMAAEVPVSLVVENLNGQQRIVKTYELPPGTDPETLKEPSFEYDGFTYTWAYTTKEEHTFLETKAVTEKVTVETVKKDLNVVLEQLAPSIPYDDGEFSGELTLDHTTITTEAAGYTTKSGKVTATKTIGQRYVLRSGYHSQGRQNAQSGQCGVAGHRDGPGWGRSGPCLLSGGSDLFRVHQQSGSHRLCLHRRV